MNGVANHPLPSRDTYLGAKDYTIVINNDLTLRAEIFSLLFTIFVGLGWS